MTAAATDTISNETVNGDNKTTTTDTDTDTDPHPHLTALRRDGYVVIRSILPPHLLLALQATSKYLTNKARAGGWPYVRTVPKQYPPWPETQPGEKPNIWGIQHLLHPDMLVRDVFAEVYFNREILDTVKELVGLDRTPDSDSSLVMELFNLLVSPGSSTDFELRWHRDDIKPDVSAADETRLLAEKCPGGRQLHAQYNIALWDDASLVVVPGSHARPRTDVERDADPYAAALPNQLVVGLGPGDAVFYDSNILHRGVYKGVDERVERGRMTLHGSVGLAGHGTERARQVLQHAVGDWVGRAQFSALEGRKREVAEGMRQRLMAMGTGEGLGYSLEG